MVAFPTLVLYSMGKPVLVPVHQLVDPSPKQNWPGAGGGAFFGGGSFLRYAVCATGGGLAGGSFQIAFAGGALTSAGKSSAGGVPALVVLSILLHHDEVSINANCIFVTNSSDDTIAGSFARRPALQRWCKITMPSSCLWLRPHPRGKSNPT